MLLRAGISIMTQVQPREVLDCPIWARLSQLRRSPLTRALQNRVQPHVSNCN